MGVGTKWKMKGAPESVPVEIDPSHYETLLAEIAEILYSAACQLPDSSTADLDSTLAPTTGLTSEVCRHG